MSRTLQSPSRPNAVSRLFPATLLPANPCVFGGQQPVSRTTALSIEFVAKPSESHKVQTALPAAIHGSLGEVAGFSGGFVLIANYEARLVTVVTLWTGEDRLHRCGENLKWVRALLNPYMDRCLRVQTLAAYTPEVKPAIETIAGGETDAVAEMIESEEEAICAA